MSGSGEYVLVKLYVICHYRIEMECPQENVLVYYESIKGELKTRPMYDRAFISLRGHFFSIEIQ